MVKKHPVIKNTNKGSALYYVMVMLIVVTLILSGALYATYRNALVTNNYSSAEEDYFKCDAALEALRGQLAASLVGKNYPGVEKMTGVTQDYLFVFKDDAVSGFDDKKNNEYLPVELPQNDYKGFYIYLVKDCREVIKCDEAKGFKVTEEQNKDNNGTWISTSLKIVDVVAEYGGVRITTTIVINIDGTNTGSFTDVVFENYRVETIQPQTEEPAEGGAGE